MDSRFDTSSWSKADLQAAKVADEEEVDTQDESDRSLGRESDEESATDLEEEEDGSTDKVLKPLSKAELDAFAAKQKKRGVIYISRIPPGMTVPKVKHLLESFGTVDRIFLHDGTLKPGEKRECKQRLTVFSEVADILTARFRETHLRPLHRRLGRIHIETCGQSGCRDAQCPANRCSSCDEEQHESSQASTRPHEGQREEMERRRVDNEVPARVQVAHAH